MTTIEDAVKTAIEDAVPNSKVTVDNVKVQPAPVLPPHVAANICKMLERVQVTGMESVAWVEAYQALQQFALQGQGAPTGVPFRGLGG